MDGGVRSTRPPPPPNNPPAPNTRLLRLEAPRQMIGRVLRQNVLQKLKKKKKKKKESQVRASRTHWRSSALHLRCFNRPSAAQHSRTFCSPTFHCAQSDASLTAFSATRAAEQDEENGREKREQVDGIQNFNKAGGEKIATKEAAQL